MSIPPSAAEARSARPVLPRIRVAFVGQVGLVGAALVIYALVLVQAGMRHQDFDAYLAGARALWQGQPLYSTFLGHPFPDATLRPAYIYPPAFALLVAPIALLPAAVAGILWLLIQQICLAAALLVIIRWLRPSSWALTVLLCTTLTFYPLWVDSVQGQANILVLLLVTVGLAGIARGKAAFAIALGLAAALKLTPLVLLAWLVLDRRLRAAAWMAGACASATALAALVRFQDTRLFFTEVLPALASGTAFYANQSLSGVLARLFSDNPYTKPWLAIPWEPVLPAIVGVLLVGWWFRWTRGDAPLVRATAFVPLLPLLSTVTWSHHLVILLPVLWCSVIALAGRNWPVLPTLGLAGFIVLFSLVSRWPVGPPFGEFGFRGAQTADPVVFLAANTLFFGTTLLFLVAPWLLRSR